MEDILRNFDLVPFDLVMIGVGAVLFVTLWQALQAVLFKPYLSLVEAREAATSGTETRARLDEEKAASLLRDYEEKLTGERIAALRVKLDSVSKAKAEAARLVERAEGEARMRLEKTRQEISREAMELQRSSLLQVEAIADLIVQRVKDLVGPDGVPRAGN